MAFFYGISAFFCLLYYVLIIIYSGLATSFSFFWLLAGAVFIILDVWYLYLKKYPDKIKIPLWAKVSFRTVTFVGVLVFIIVEAFIVIGMASQTSKDLDYIIVLGAQVKGQTVGNTLKKRLDKAIEYLDKHPQSIIILSGGQGTGEDISEAEAMYQYLLYNGVSSSQMMKEDRSTSTLENIAYSHVLIDQREKLVKVKQHLSNDEAERKIEIGIISSNFHVFRAVSIAKKIGLQNIYGIAAESDPILQIHYCVRECFAILKDKLMGNL